MLCSRILNNKIFRLYASKVHKFEGEKCLLRRIKNELYNENRVSTI